MDSESETTSLSYDHMNILADFSKLKSSYLENKDTITKLEKFVALLKEEVRISRDAERTAEYMKSCSQQFTSQLQQTINKLLGVKQENVSLQQSMRDMENSKKDLIKEFKDQLEKKDDEMKQLKKNHIMEILSIKESADEEVLKANSATGDRLNSSNLRCMELEAELSFTKSENKELKEKMKKLTERIVTLQMQNKELNERSANNITIFQKKLLEQQRQHEIELDTWKQAEINRLPNPQNTNTKALYTNTQTPHYSGSIMNPYVTNLGVLQTKQSIYQSNRPALNVTLSKKVPSFQTASELHRQIQVDDESDEDIIEEIMKDSEDLSITVNKSKPRYPAAVRKRKLYTSNSDWAD